MAFYYDKSLLKMNLLEEDVVPAYHLWSVPVLWLICSWFEADHRLEAAGVKANDLFGKTNLLEEADVLAYNIGMGFL